MAQDIISQPPIREPFNTADGAISRAWAAWMQQAFRIMFAAAQSGTTAQRPTENLYPGRQYFDTSLGAKGKPIWVDKTGAAWVLADGTVA